MLADRGLALAFELAVQQGELPGRRRLFGQDAVTPAEEAQVLRLVGDMVQARQSRADMEIHVGEEIMLRTMEADAHRCRIALADFEINVAHRRIEGAGIGIGDIGIGRYAVRRREGHFGARLLGPCGRPRAGTNPCKDHHGADALLVAGGIVAQHKDGTVCAPADHPHRRPHINCAGDAIAALRHEHDAFLAVAGGLVYCRLKGCAVIGLAIAPGAGDGDGTRIVGSRGIGRSPRFQRQDGRGCQQQKGQEQLFHEGLRKTRGTAF